MAKLTKAQRNALRSNQFVFPKTRQYPVPDKGHAQYALKVGAIQNTKGNLSTSKYNQIVRKVNKDFGFHAKLRKTNAIKPKK